MNFTVWVLVLLKYPSNLFDESGYDQRSSQEVIKFLCHTKPILSHHLQHWLKKESPYDHYPQENNAV